MNKIDVNNWKKFHLYDKGLFIIDMGTKLDKSKMTVVNPIINFVGRANTNNGITASIDIIKGVTPYESGNMTLSLGGEYLGSCFIQPKAFYTSQNVVVLIPQWDMPQEVKMFISAMIFKESRTHYKAFVDELNRHIKTDFSFYLPINKKGEPDWEYMESYMKNVMQNAKKNIENLSNISKTKNNIPTKEWINYSCSKLFTVVNTGNILARDIEDGSGDTPYVTASGINNGVVAHIDASKYDIIKGHCILIGGKTFTVTYQADDFVSNDSHNFVIRTNGYDISDLTYKYLVTVISSYFGQKYSWNDAVTKDKFLSEMIPLPANTNGEPDWEYMENYMKNIMQDTQSKLDKLVCC